MPYFAPASSGSGTPATTVTDESTWGIASAVGSSTNYARQDHTHGMSDTAQVLGVTTKDVQLQANYSANPVDVYEIGSGFVTDLAAGAVLNVII